MIKPLFNFCKNLGCRIKQQLKQWSKPVTATLVTGSLTDMTRSKADLIAENAMLRQQLIILNRQVKRPQLTNGDRLRLVSWPAVPTSGNTPCTLFNLIPCCGGTATCFASTGDTNQETRNDNLVWLKKPST
ncbi:hypothetical protein ACFLXQ_08080 [Chloroflexota bacterium]